MSAELASKNDLRIAILTDNSLQQHSLLNVMKSSEFTPVVSILTDRKNWREQVTALDPSPDAWLVEVDLDGAHAQEVEDWLENVEVPVILGDGKAPNIYNREYQGWSRRVREKILQLRGSINVATEQHKLLSKSTPVWILAASTGGPAAVKVFLQGLPPNLGIAFIYVQHIDAEFDTTLAQAISSHSAYPASVLNHGDTIAADQVGVISAEYATELKGNGSVVVAGGGWPGIYTPSIDMVAANAAQVFGRRLNIIIFTGLGNDGASSSRLVHRAGGKVWAQSPETCVSPSMPEAAIKGGCVDFRGSLEVMAEALSATRQGVSESPTV